ncbi:9795_t:CDS:2, partial [Dentiscutata erythropus]
NQPTSDEDTTSENSESDQLFAEAKLRLYRNRERIKPSLHSEISTPFEFTSTQETTQAFNYNEEEEHNPAHIFSEENYSEETPETQPQLPHRLTYPQGETFAESSRTSSQLTEPQQFIIPLSDEEEDIAPEEIQVINLKPTHEPANLEEEAAR